MIMIMMTIMMVRYYVVIRPRGEPPFLRKIGLSKIGVVAQGGVIIRDNPVHSTSHRFDSFVRRCEKIRKVWYIPQRMKIMMMMMGM